MSNEYGADQIKVLEGLEAVRKRPGMYIGGTGVGPLHHLIYEVVDNSIDEAMAGFATTVWVTVMADGSCCVLDNGRGIPVEPKKDSNPAYDGKPAIELAMTVLHAGGKFENEGGQSAYKVSGGLHGVGVSCVNALSEWLEAEVYRHGKIHAIGFERGRTTEPLKIVGDIPSDSPFKTGTKVTFSPDPEIFADTRFDYAVLATRLRELSYLNPGVTIKLTDERVGADGKPRSETFRAVNGLREYVQHLMQGKEPVSECVVVKKDDAATGQVCEVAMQYHDGYNEMLLSFANNINNKDGGTHAAGFKVALTRALNAYAKRSGILKEKDPTPTGEDLREGLVAIVSVKLSNPTFNNQPKEKLLNPEIEKFVSDAVGEQLEIWLGEHPAEAKRLCLKGIVAAQAREAARKARELTRRKNALDGGSMPHKLRDCKTRDVERSEIFIVEGDSAGGTATQGRDVETQAILPLKGKILNVEKARLDKVLGFEEIRVLISALRCGIGEEFDISKLRYGRIVIMTDADVDGSHIRTLLLTFFFRQMPELIRRGKVFIAQPPLYKLTWGKGKNARVEYVLNDARMNDLLDEQGLSRARLVVRDLEGYVPGRGGEAKVARSFEGEPLRRLIRVLRRLAELTGIVERRGVKFPDLLASRAHDPSGGSRLPTHRVTWMGGEAWAWSEEQARGVLSERGLHVLEPGDGGDAPDPGANGTARPPATHDPRKTAFMRELHENRELERLFEQLGRLGFSIEDYSLKQELAVSGERLPAKFAWELVAGAAATGADEAGAGTEDAAVAADEHEEPGEEVPESAERRRESSGRFVEAPSLPEIVEKLQEVGGRGVSITRFKGLGEMDASQLRDTTMDYARRTLLRVNWDVAGEAEMLFSVLMGENVEERRKYIEEHALEVTNLDV
ncbi:MAG: DNA gyrase subunit B [Phycisphaerales bacterium]